METDIEKAASIAGVKLDESYNLQQKDVGGLSGGFPLSRFAVFEYDPHQQCGGLYDFAGSTDSAEVAIEYMTNNPNDMGYIDIVDMQTGLHFTDR